jgi:DNA invertase Pin-like site-specific DNA recombinase
LYRRSDDRQENSILRQRQGLEPYARRRGYDTVAEYVFDGIPGDEINRHPDWLRLLQDAEAGKWSILLVDEPSRLSREDPDYFVRDVKIPLKEAGVQVDSASKGLLDWETLSGDIMTLIHSHESREEVRKMSRRVLAGMARKAKDGAFFGWRCPYGLRIERIIDPSSGKVIDRKCVFGPEEEVRTIRFIFDAVANRGWSLRRIRRELEARGVKPPLSASKKSGKPGTGYWSRNTLARILRNRKYVGDLPWNETHQGKYSQWKDGAVQQDGTSKRRRGPSAAEDWIVVPDLIPPLIDRDTFTRAGAVLVASQKRTSPSREQNYLFTRTLVCGDCGAFLRGEIYRGQKVYLCSAYKEHGVKACYRNKVEEKSLLESIVAVLLNDVLNPTRLDAIEEEMKRLLEAERDTGGVERLRQQIGALERDIAQGNDRLVRLPEDRIPGIVAKLRSWEKERDELQIRLAEMESGTSRSQAILDEARRQLWRLRESLEGNDEEVQATVIREVVARIEVRFAHEKTPGRYSKKGKGGKLLTRPTGAVLYVRPGLGLSCLSTSL